MKKIIYIMLCALLLLGGCKNAEHDVNVSIVHFYKNHETNYQEVDRKLLSKELANLLDKSIAREKFEFDWTAKSEHPTNKPFFIEADVFASHQEGDFQFAVNKITVNGNKAIVVMDFTSTFAATNDVEKWSEQVQMVNESGWKVDDIIYPKGERYLDGETLKQVFTDYINATEAEAHPS